MSDTAAAIKGKGLEHTGVTEDYANQMFDRVGTHYVGVVDLVVTDRQGPNLDGKRKVFLAIDTIELAPNDDVAEHIRRLMRATHYERGLAVNGGDQLPLEGASDEPTVEQVRAAGRAHEPDPEADERAAAEREADDDDTTEPTEEPADDPWDEGPPPAIGKTSGVTSPFDIPEPEPTPAA